MDFNEFYSLLNEAITKDKSNVTPSDENFNIYLMNRYLSFYHSEIAIHIAKTTNRLGFIPDDEDAYYCIKSICQCDNILTYLNKCLMISI